MDSAIHSLHRVEEYRILYRPDPALRGEWTTSIIQAADFRSAAAGNLQGHSYSCLHLRHEGVVFRGSFTFYQLTPASQYEVMVQVSTVQYSTVKYSTIQHGTVQCSTIQYSTVRYCTVQSSTIQYSTSQYSIQYSTA